MGGNFLKYDLSGAKGKIKDLNFLGNGDNEYLILGAGNDTAVMDGGDGADVLDGGANGAGGDTVSYAGSDAGVTVNLATQTVSGGDAEGDTISSFENVTGSDFADDLTGVAAGVAFIFGGGGNDVISTGKGGVTADGGDNLQLAGTLDGIVFVDEDTSFTLLADNFVFV